MHKINTTTLSDDFLTSVVVSFAVFTDNPQHIVILHMLLVPLSLISPNFLRITDVELSSLWLWAKGLEKTFKLLTVLRASLV
ncbi:hypothetical protein Vi05172_g2559 [Venturia inaequalis]|nr:hypothetical protein Vi05172_g2559 [Venturia inaequalis]